MPDDANAGTGGDGDQGQAQTGGAAGGTDAGNGGSQQQQTSAPPSDQLGDAGRRALEQERAARRDAEKRLKELEDAEPVKKAERLEAENESLKRKHADAARELEEAKMSQLRLEVGLAKGLAPDLAARLRGADQKELEADADRLLESMGGQQGRSFDGGARRQTGKPSDMNSLIRTQAGRPG